MKDLGRQLRRISFQTVSNKGVLSSGKNHPQIPSNQIRAVKRRIGEKEDRVEFIEIILKERYILIRYFFYYKMFITL